MHQRYRDQGLVVLAVNVGESAELVKSYVAKHRLTFPHGLDTTRKIAAQFAVPGTPATFLIDRQGRLLGGGSGYRDWVSPAALKLVENLLAAR